MNGDFIIYVDESGDHSLNKIDKDYPLFVLSFSCFKIGDYVDKVVPEVQRFKFKHFGHDQVILHETDIRKSREPFSFLRLNKNIRAEFLTGISDIVFNSPFTFFSIVIDKKELQKKYAKPFNPYFLSLRYGLEALNTFLISEGQKGNNITVVFEQRGKKEDQELKREFNLIVHDNLQFGYKQMNFTEINYKFLLSDKKSNSTGLQIADLTARPIGLKYLRPEAVNRSFDTFADKIISNKVFP